MYSNRPEHGHSRHYSDRGSRQWDGYDDRWEERPEPHRDVQRDSHYKYGGEGHSGVERTSRSREYSDSPKRLYSKDSLNRDRGRKSPLRRRMSSPDWGASELKRRRFTEGDGDHYRYRREEKSSRQSPDGFSRSHVPKDFKHTPPQEEDLKYRRTSQDSRHRYRHEESTYRQQHDDLTCRRSSGYYKDRERERSWDWSEERTRSHDHSTKTYAKSRERNDSPVTDHEDRRLSRTRFPLSASSGQSFESDATHRSSAVHEPKKSTKGFQRFLDVLNKGVNVTTLTKIVTQTSTEADDRPRSPTSFTNTADRPWSPGRAERQRGSHQSASRWAESEGSQRPPSPQPRRLSRSFSPQRRSLSDEKAQQRGEGERGRFRSSSRSGSPAAVEKIALTPEEEHKHRQMQDVLQAIGMNLGFEELGQMSHRIQERLYGKKDGDGGRNRRGSREKDARRASSPRPHSRSSSSRSSFSPPPREYYMKEDSYSAQRDASEVHQAADYGQNSSVLQESEKCDTDSRESAAVFSQNPSYAMSEPPAPPPVMPMYSPANCSPLPYPPLPPILPRVGPGLFLPRLPPFLPYPRVPPLNIFPAVLAQTRHLFPQHVANPHPLLNPPAQPLNTTQKSKPLSRPRCLQVIETKQPG